MSDWIEELRCRQNTGRPLSMAEEPLPGSGRVLALAPHPDDPESVAVTLRLLARGGWDVRYSVVTSGWSGVHDSFVGPERARKAEAREQEQRAAGRLFGLAPERLVFLRLAEAGTGELADTAENRARLEAHLRAVGPDVILLPYGHDSNAAHRRVYAWASDWARGQAGSRLILGNQDPKTLGYRLDFEVRFGAQTAAWKTRLLECHQSQSRRNQVTRGTTFAARILAVNRMPDSAATPETYAERFQVEFLGRAEAPAG